MADVDELLAVEQAWEYLGVSRATLWNLVRRYRIPRYSIPTRGKRVFFRRADLDQLREPVPRSPTEQATRAAEEADGPRVRKDQGRRPGDVRDRSLGSTQRSARV